MNGSDEPRSPRPGTLEYYAREQPEEPALVDGGVSFTWRRWNDAANRLADALARRGLRQGDRVAVRMMNRIEWFVVDAALAKIGAIRVAVGYRLTPNEIRYLLGNSAARAFVFDDEHVAAVRAAWAPAGPGEHAVELVIGVGASDAPDVQPLDGVLKSGEPVERVAEARSESLIYTSGTTGRPKGVQRTTPSDEGRRQALRAMNDDLKRSIPYRRGDRNLLCAPLHHAAAPSSALATHARGGTVHLMRRFDPQDALRVIAEHRITVSFMVPTMLNRIVNLPEDVRARFDVSSVRIITTGASPCSVELKERVSRLFGPVLYESYGCTETGVITIMTPDQEAAHPGSCGRLLEGADVRIVGEDGSAVSRGQVGEIFIRSPLTATAYVGETNYDSNTYRDGYFSAGDVGRLDEDGYLYILDRKKDMIISGGVNIYPAEIEAVLREHPAILDAAVFGVPNAEWGEAVKAVCELVPDRRITEDEILDFCRESLADYKRPRFIEFTGELPRNGVGKVLKGELRARHWEALGRKI